MKLAQARGDGQLPVLREWLSLLRQRMGRTANVGEKADLQEAIVHGAVKRIRPKMMTVMAMFMGLLPIMWSIGAGSGAGRSRADPLTASRR